MKRRRRTTGRRAVSRQREAVRRFFRHLRYLTRLYGTPWLPRLDFLSRTLLLFGCLGSFSYLVYQFGFPDTVAKPDRVGSFLPSLLWLFFSGTLLRYLTRIKDVYRARLFIVDGLLFLLNGIVLWLLYAKGVPAALGAAAGPVAEAVHGAPIPSAVARFFKSVTAFLLHPYFIYGLLAVLTFVHGSQMSVGLVSRKIKPTFLFILSFLLLIFVGTGLLLLPRVTYDGISFVDALFMATTSVCVTGLTVVDVGQTFTPAGQIIILVLIQIGGIGVITFTSFFALSFMGSASVGGQFVLKDLLNEKNLGNLFRALALIIGISFMVEAVGAWLIYRSIAGTMSGAREEIYMAVFHAVSAYCNAGISPLSDSLGGALLHNHRLHFWIACLILIGGIGFPIVLNYLRLLRHVFGNVLRRLFRFQQVYHHEPRIIQLHTALVLTVTAVLVVGGTLLFFLSERNNTLTGLSPAAQWAESFFYATVFRTAGFSTYAPSLFSPVALLFTMVVMAIGASPMSTGGGIKTSSVAVAALTAFHIVRGRDEVEVRGRRLERGTIRQAFAIITLFIGYVCLMTGVLCFLEPAMSLKDLLFETISATATVGSSMGVTASFGTAGKLCLILSMFIGRIGVLTFFTGITRDVEPKRYAYPYDTVLLT